MSEGARLLFLNLTRAANLVHSFKQVAADQVSGESRTIELRTWLNELLTSLGPVLRKRQLAVEVECRPGLAIETYPGALGQVLTNLVVNAAVHGFDDGQAGQLRIAVHEPGFDRVALEVSDNGAASPPTRSGACSIRSSPPRASAAAPGSGCTSSTISSSRRCADVSRCGARPGAEPCFASTSRIL